ncbi:ABC transporter permease [Streptomyces spinosisporus]|uniref:ABC transporter permease n=1 Tax=Streptomyces spinosisporus TaxID=2927582 RepID=A0ABS9XK97_9ACTN|nr:ABC transporter permease [Streptomyces spinosisporus]MCI3242047.1 ABC transporter permease [Streptomyces spinosisporus]
MPLREPTTRLSALVLHNALLMLREPGPLLSRMLLPLAFMTLLRPLYLAAQGRAAGTQQVVVGTLVTFSLLALSIAGSAILAERLGRTWDRLRGTPLHPVELLLGKAAPVLVALLAQQLLIIGFGAGVFGLGLPHPFLLLGVLLSWSGTLLGLGALIGVLVRSMGELSAAYDIGGMLLSSVGGALVPLSELPAWVADVAPVSPGYWATRGLHAALDGDTHTVVTACGTLLGTALVCGALASIRLRGRSSRLVAL